MKAGLKVTPNVQLRELLGQGAMGSVWRADQLALDTEVVVKFILPQQHGGGHADAVKRFRREASTAAKLSSPHVVRVFDFGLLEETTPFIVMELLKGETLAERLQRKRRLTPAQTVHVVDQVAKVLTEAHSLSIIHRDIKPANLFLVGSVDSAADIFVKVLDFGVAKTLVTAAETSITATGAIIGTPAYMSPEQLRGEKKTDQQADLWALSAVAYECITGSLPFAGDTLGELILTIHNSHATAPSQKVSGLPAELDAFFARALNRSREERFGSALELATACKQALSGVLVDDEPPSTELAPGSPGRSALDLADTESASFPPPADDVGALSTVAVGSGSGNHGTIRSESAGRSTENVASDAAMTATIAGTLAGATGAPPPPRKSSRAVVAIGVAAAVGSLAWFALSPERPARQAATSQVEAAPSADERASVASAPVVPSLSTSPERSTSNQALVAVPTTSPSATTTTPTSTASPSPRPQRSAVLAVTASARTKPTYCTTDAGFMTNDKGFLVPRPECL